MIRAFLIGAALVALALPATASAAYLPISDPPRSYRKCEHYYLYAKRVSCAQARRMTGRVTKGCDTGGDRRCRYTIRYRGRRWRCTLRSEAADGSIATCACAASEESGSASTAEPSPSAVRRPAWRAAYRSASRSWRLLALSAPPRGA
jgi:hypothetical protein